MKSSALLIATGILGCLALSSCSSTEPQKNAAAISNPASEYCVKETVLSLLQSGRSVTLLVPGLGWVAEEDHKKALAELKDLGALLVEA